ncbi:MAG: hypothetical protein GX224_05700 [Thermoplasmatales archaeon]|nr:hypothetical protein [Thermoplasmatales archaeon]
MDGNYKGTAEEFKDKYGIPNNFKVYKMGRDWNNYCPGIADGLDAMFNQLYGPYTPEEESPISENSTLIWASVAATVGIISVAAILVRRQ